MLSSRDSPPFVARRRTWLATVVFVTCFSLPGLAGAKTLIDYFQPAPTTCALTSNTWGASGVLPRDTCNGMEDPKNPPGLLYWDGKIIRASDGQYHLLASRWPDSPSGHNGWFGSDAIHAVSASSPLGPYVDKGFAYTNGPDSGDRSKGHNVSACQMNDGTYCLIVSEIVPFTIFTSPSLNGPWTRCPATGDLIQTNGVPAGSDTHYDSNVSLVVRPDGNFEIVQRHGLIALSTTGICGPYKLQQPTNTYPSSEAVPANIASIYPNRTRHADSMAPATVESTYALAEDPVIWYSGGQYHVVYDYPDDRVGYHLTSPDGIHGWSDQGLAYDPRLAQQLFSYNEGTVDHWFKMERPGVLIEGGHITHFTFAVTDVDKGQITAGSNHGNKVIVVAFDGATFDAETGIGVGGAGGGGGQAGSGGAGGAAGMGGAGASTGFDGGASGAGGIEASGGASGRGGAGGSIGAGGLTGGGGSGGGGAHVGSAGGASGPSGTGTGGQTPRAAGGASGAVNGSAAGCSCATLRTGPGSNGGWLALMALLVTIRRRRRL